MLRPGRYGLAVWLLGVVGLVVGQFVLSCNENESELTKEVLEQPVTIPSAGRSAPTSSGQPSALPANEMPKDAAALRVALGQKHYVKYCALCHGASGEGYVADNAPSLVSKTFLESASDGFLQRAIRMGRPNTAMAAYGDVRGGPLSEPDISAIVAYLRTLGPKYTPLRAYRVRGDAKRGEELFAAQCGKCHGDEENRGNALSLHNPELLASASPAFLKHAILNGRAPTPMPAFRGQLTESQIDDIIAWLKGIAPAEPASPPVQSPTVPKDLPMVINPKGKPPTFKLRADRFVSALKVKEALGQKRRMIIIDARSAADWIQFHIPGSVPIGYYETDRLSQVPNDGTWVVAYCACPHHASGAVVDALRRKGYKNTAILDEGILEWKRRGYPLAGEAAPSTAPGKAATKSAGANRTPSPSKTLRPPNTLVSPPGKTSSPKVSP